MAAVSMMAYQPRDSFQSYTPQRAGMYQTPAQDPRSYSRQASDASSYSYHQSHSRSSSTWSVERPVAADAQKPSLPPISDLLHIADGERSRKSVDASPPSSRALYDYVPPRPERSLFPPHPPSPPRRSWVDSMSPSLPGHKRSIDQAHGVGPPPFRHNSAGDGAHSPSAISTTSTSSLPPHLAAMTVNKVETGSQRTDSAHGIHATPPQAQPVHSPAPPHPTSMPSPYSAATSAPPSMMRYSPTHHVPTENQPPAPTEDIYSQRPLPANFPPPPIQHPGAAPPPGSVAAPPPPPSQAQQQQQQVITPPQQQQPDSNPWQHHHYISTSAHTTFPPSQDRYICPTCNKAFSRPSSLKIHSHSHTGEKPFRCPHANCGKAFSVRSNMKRHERGCHSGIGGGGSGGGGSSSNGGGSNFGGSQNGEDSAMMD